MLYFVCIVWFTNLFIYVLCISLFCSFKWATLHSICHKNFNFNGIFPLHFAQNVLIAFVAAARKGHKKFFYSRFTCWNFLTGHVRIFEGFFVLWNFKFFVVFVMRFFWSIIFLLKNQKFKSRLNFKKSHLKNFIIKKVKLSP